MYGCGHHAIQTHPILQTLTLKETQVSYRCIGLRSGVCRLGHSSPVLVSRMSADLIYARIGVAASPQPVTKTASRCTLQHSKVSLCLQRRLTGNASASLSGNFSVSDERPFETELDFKAHLAFIANVCCWVLPALLLVFVGRPSAEPPASWLGWVWRCTRALLIVCLSFTISVLTRYGLREKQVRACVRAAAVVVYLGDVP